MLTLSATPIPRTLNMAMSGIRDMSVIDEPPQDRHPVQTYVVEYNPGMLIQAIIRSLKGAVRFTISITVLKRSPHVPQSFRSGFRTQE